MSRQLDQTCPSSSLSSSIPSHHAYIFPLFLFDLAFLLPSLFFSISPFVFFHISSIYLAIHLSIHPSIILFFFFLPPSLQSYCFVLPLFLPFSLPLSLLSLSLLFSTSIHPHSSFFLHFPLPTLLSPFCISSSLHSFISSFLHWHLLFFLLPSLHSSLPPFLPVTL